MKPVALALLAGLLLVALFQFVPWQDEGTFDTVLDEAGGAASEISSVKIDSDLEEAIPESMVEVPSPDRRKLGIAKIRVRGQLRDPKGVAVVGTKMQLRLGDAAKKGLAAFFLLASSTRPPDAVTETDGDGRVENEGICEGLTLSHDGGLPLISARLANPGFSRTKQR